MSVKWIPFRISGTSEALLTLEPTEQSLLYLAEAYDGLPQQWRACQDWLTSVLVFSTWQLWWIRRTTFLTNFFSRRVDCGVASQRPEWVQRTVLFEKSADAISSLTHSYFLVEIHRNVLIRRTISVRRLQIERERWSEDWVNFYTPQTRFYYSLKSRQELWLISNGFATTFHCMPLTCFYLKLFEAENSLDSRKVGQVQ